MEPLYSTGASSNYTGYANPEFDEAVDRANAAAPDEADALYQEAEDILMEDMPVMPLFYQDYFVVHTPRVDNVYSDLASYVRVEDVVVTEN